VPSGPPRRSAAGGRARALALDIGGTKIAAAVVDADGTLRGAARRPVPTFPSAPADLDRRGGLGGRNESEAPDTSEHGTARTARTARTDLTEPTARTGLTRMDGPTGAIESDGPESDRADVEPVFGPAEAVFGAVRDCAAEALAAAGAGVVDLAGVGCGCAGPMRWPAGEVSPLNIPAWRAFPLRDRLRELFAGLPVLVHNDGIALAAGEHWAGAGRGVRNLLAVTVSTGVGGGLVLGGRLLHGSSGNAGHIGHVVVEADGPACPCGGRGCVEAIAAGPHTVRRALAAGWTPVADEPADGRALARAAAAGDGVARGELARAGSAVGAGLASCASLLDLDVAVVAGGFAQSGPIFWAAVLAAFERHAGLAFARRMRIMRSADPSGVALRGAAAFVLAPERCGWPDD
jgi:glucokinase